MEESHYEYEKEETAKTVEKGSSTCNRNTDTYVQLNQTRTTDAEDAATTSPI
jgi:hypothetical protein